MVTTIKKDLTNKQYGTYDIEQPAGPEDDCVEHDETEDLPAFLEDKYDQPAGPEDEVDDYDEDGTKSVTAEDAFVEVDDSGEAGLMTPSEITAEQVADQAEADDPANYNEEQD